MSVYCCFFGILQAGPGPAQVNIYAWYEFIPKEILQKFEQETGIKVHIDYYDSNQTLETNLLTRTTGYDVVFPSAFPYMERQVKNGLYQKLDKNKLPNLKYLDPDILKFLESADPGHNFTLPYFWGITGIAYNIEQVQQIMPQAPVDSWAMLFDPKVVQRFAPHGVYLLDETIEVFASTLTYLKLSPVSKNASDWQAAFKALQKIRPYIRRFDSLRGHQDLVNGEVALIQSWSGDIALARQYARAAGRKIQIAFSVPKEGSSISIEVMAIPKNAPNLDNAHTFINFLMRPDIIAIATNELGYSNANLASLPFLNEELRNDPLIVPDKQVLKRLYVSTFVSRAQEQQTNRMMMRLKANLKAYTEVKSKPLFPDTLGVLIYPSKLRDSRYHKTRGFDFTRAYK
ncbi:MAG: extracellular solute-binding protein [Pseudomonadota bacterium]